MIVPDWVSLTADTGSVVGLIITIAVWFQARAIRKSFVAKARLPELSTNLKAISSDLLKRLEDRSSHSQDFTPVIARLRGLLTNLQPKVNGSQHEMVRVLLKLCGGEYSRIFFWKSGASHSFTTDRVWRIYGDTQGLLEALNQAAKDSKWS